MDGSTSTRSENMIIQQNRKIFKNAIASARKHKIVVEKIMEGEIAHMKL